MKIRELNFAAFGPFTDKVLTFDKDGLQIVYGPNEAGKSSALRGLKALLYGIAPRTLDNFIHANDKLRISGVLQSADGNKLAFTRRKGLKNTLLTSDDEVLDEQVLAPFLQGVTRELFETLFGIDHPALVQGGQEILEQKGEIGQALFSAALGSRTLHAVMTELDDTAKGLFLPSGSKPVINSAIRSHTDLRAEIRKSSLSSREWDEQRRALGRTTKELEEIQLELTENRSEVNRLQRIQRVLPKLSRRRELIQGLERLGDVVVLPDDFSDRRQKAVNELETAQALLDRATPRLEGLQKQREALLINQALLDQAEGIEGLHARLGGHRKALQERPRLQAEREQLLTDAESILKGVHPNLPLKDIEQLRPVLSRRQQVADLGSKNAVLSARVEQAEASLRDTSKRLARARKERDDIPEFSATDSLRRAINAARKQGELDAAIESAERDLKRLRAECTTLRARLTLWRGELEDVPGLALPERESIHRFEEDYEKLVKRIQRLEENKETVAESLRDAALRLDEIERVGEVPTEAALINARSERDEVWQLLRRQWVDGEVLSAEAQKHQSDESLPDAFENHVLGADEVSDRLRREAERVHTLASLQAKQKAEQRQEGEIIEQLEATTAEKARLDASWAKLWAPCEIFPHSPREMRGWLDRFERLRDNVTQLNLLNEKVQELTQNRARHIQWLNEQLTGLGRGTSASEELETVILECEELADQLDGLKRTFGALTKDVKDREAEAESLGDEHRRATDALEAWKLQWAEQMKSVGLQSDALPLEVNDFIDSVRELFLKLSDAEKLQIRMDAIDKDVEAFRGEAGAMVAQIAPELTGLSADDAVARLNILLSENRSKQTTLQQLAEQVKQAVADIQGSNATINTMTKHLNALSLEAACASDLQGRAKATNTGLEATDLHQLEAAERRSVEYLRIKTDIDSVEQEILDLGEGATIAELETQAEGIDPDRLPGRVTELNNKIEDELEPRRTELAEKKGREERELELMDGSDHAAVLADQAQATLASMRSDVERYIHAKLAGRILRNQVERYRQKNQGPLVKRASEHFRALTLGSFDGLVTDFNDKDEPILAGIRPGGARVAVEGMSSGTRDQLYLALRLASLEKYMESSEPMPFIVDDILVDFDDDRSQAALNVLAKLGERTQVILFTHHLRVVEQSKKVNEAVKVQEL